MNCRYNNSNAGSALPVLLRYGPVSGPWLWLRLLMGPLLWYTRSSYMGSIWWSGDPKGRRGSWLCWLLWEPREPWGKRDEKNDVRRTGREDERKEAKGKTGYEEGRKNTVYRVCVCVTAVSIRGGTSVDLVTHQVEVKKNYTQEHMRWE